MRARVLFELHNAFHLAVSAVNHQAQPGPGAALSRLRDALDDAGKLGDVSIIAAGPTWWASAQALTRRWLEASDDVRRDTTDVVAAVLKTVLEWQQGRIGLPPDARLKPVRGGV